MPPLFEKIFGGVQHQPMNVVRIYPDGEIFIFASLSDEDRWKRIGKLKRNDLTELKALLASPEVDSVFKQAESKGSTESAGAVWRSYHDGTIRETATSTRDEGGRLPTVLDELSRFRSRAR